MITHLENKRYGDALRRYAVENSFGMELGPLHHPYVQKTEDRDVMYVDYQSTQKLKEANKDNPQIDIADIVELDYVWAPGTHLPPLRGCLTTLLPLRSWNMCRIPWAG